MWPASKLRIRVRRTKELMLDLSEKSYRPNRGPSGRHDDTVGRIAMQNKVQDSDEKGAAGGL